MWVLYGAGLLQGCRKKYPRAWMLTPNYTYPPPRPPPPSYAAAAAPKPLSRPAHGGLGPPTRGRFAAGPPSPIPPLSTGAAAMGGAARADGRLSMLLVMGLLVGAAAPGASATLAVVVVVSCCSLRVCLWMILRCMQHTMLCTWFCKTHCVANPLHTKHILLMYLGALRAAATGRLVVAFCASCCLRCASNCVGV